MASEPKPNQDEESSESLQTFEDKRESIHRELRDARDRLIALAIVNETLIKQVCSEANQRIAALSERLLKAESELNGIKGSLGWRLLSQYGRFKYGILLPIMRSIGLKGTAGAKTQSTGPAKSKEGAAWSIEDSILTVEPVIDRAQLPAHQCSVDVIICVHDALEETKSCLDSIVHSTRMPYSIVVVDDGSASETAGFLRDFSRSQGAVLIRNDEARGYTRAANRALNQSTADYVVLLNSDTVVTPSWIDRLIACAESDDKVGIVGPLSNAASWQSVPDTFVGATTDWAVNVLAAGNTPADSASALAQYSGRLYPEMPFLNGFCYLIKRAVIEQIGVFDEAAFGDGYGEENDYCLRAGKAGWKRTLADDAYVYHHETRSYTTEKKKELTKRADELLVQKYGSELINQGVAICHRGRVIEGIRARARVVRSREEAVQRGKELFEGRRVLFILPIAECNGGGNVVVSEASAMRRMGVDAQIVNLERHRTGFEEGYPGLDLPVSFVDRSDDIGGLVNDFDVVVATFHDSVFWLDYSRATQPRVKRAYYVQDFEPYFNPLRSAPFHHALASYTAYDDLIRIVKSEWNRKVIQEHSGAESYVNGPTVDIDLFRPRPRTNQEWPDRPLRILAMIRPMTPRRSPLFTMQVLGEIQRDRGRDIEIILFGSKPDDPDFKAIMSALTPPFPFRHAGILTRRQTASLMNEVDIFCDLSAYQALGLTALEAMACGVAVVAPSQGGASSFIRSGENGLLADTGSRESSADTLSRLVAESELRARIQRTATYDVCKYSPERSALKMLDALFGSEH